MKTLNFKHLTGALLLDIDFYKHYRNSPQSEFYRGRIEAYLILLENMVEQEYVLDRPYVDKLKEMTRAVL